MKNPNTEFNRLLYQEVMKKVKAKVSPDIIKKAWGYKYLSSGNDVEFQITKCDSLPEGFYWHGRGESVTEAKAKGWQAYLEKYHSE